jgi:Terminase large subunit, T4likevirus-type, N-terminal/Terminase RNaseH-like domain
MTQPLFDFAPPTPVTRRLSIRDLYEQWDYHPHGGQAKFHTAQKRFKVMCCGRRWGKSTAGPHEEMPKMLLRKPVMGWVVAPTYDLGEKEFRVFWDVLIDKMGVPVDKSKTFNSIRTKSFRITTAWGSSIEVRSAEHPESLVGEGLDFVIMAEAAKLKKSHWEKYIRPTLSDKRGSAIFVSTPEGFNWFYDLWQQGQSSEPVFSEWWSYSSPTWENTIVFPGGRRDPEMLEVEGTLAPEVFAQEYGAEFTSFAGRIYSEFDEGYHVIHDYEFNPNWPNYVAFDFGFRNPFVCLNIQVDPSDNVYVWDEYYERNFTSSEHARRLKSIIQWRVDGGYYDPAGPDDANTIMKVWRDSVEYRNRHVEDIRMDGAPNDWLAGVNRVKAWLKFQTTPSGEAKPKLFVSESCKNTIREFNTYRVKEQTEKMSESRDAKEEPRKKDDHAMDALRYFIAGHFGLESHLAYQA